MGQIISQQNSKVPFKWILDESHKSSNKPSTHPTKHNTNTCKHKRPIEIFCKNFRYKKSSSRSSAGAIIKTQHINNSNGSDCNQQQQQDNNKKYSNIHHYNGNSDLYSTFPFVNAGNRKNNYNDSAVNFLNNNNISSTYHSNKNNNIDEKFNNINELEFYLNYDAAAGDVNNCGSVGNYTNSFNNNNCSMMEKTYSDPYLYVGSRSTTSRQSRKCSRHRKRKYKDSSQRFGYKIRNLDEFLTKVS